MDHGVRDLALGLFFVAVALVMVAVVIPAGVDTPANVPYTVMSPRFWPRVIMYFTLAMGAIVALKGLLEWRAHRGQGGAPLPEDDPAAAIHWRGVPYILASGVLLLGYYWLMTAIGMVEASVVALLAFSALYLERRWHIVLPVAVGLPLALYGFFDSIANVPIPLGPLEGHI